MIQMILSIIFLAISLSIDAFSVGIAYSLRGIHIPFSSKMIICLFSIIYSGFSLLLGKVLYDFIPPLVSKITGVAILAIMGILILLQSMHRSDKKKQSDTIGNITIKVIKNPAEGDIDKSGTIDFHESLLLGLALSVDAIGVGIGSALSGFSHIIVPFAIGISQLLLLYLGTYLGKRILSSEKLNKKVLSLIPGILLICMAVIRLR